MTIKGLTPSLAEGGKIKIGGLGEERQGKNGSWRMPVKLDHFILTKTHRDARGDLIQDADLMAALSASGFADEDGKLRRLPVMLHSDEIDEVFPTSYAMYQGKKLACRGDGETAHRWEMRDSKRTGREKECKCPCNLLEGDKPSCKAHGTLHCSIALPDHAVAGSVHRWRTTSIISIKQLIGSMLQIRQAVGVLRNVPLQLVVRAVQVTPDTPKGPQQSTVYVCHLELHSQDMHKLQRELLDQARTRREVMAELDAVTRESYRALLRAPAADDETDDEATDTAAEFHPSKSNSVIDAGELQTKLAEAKAISDTETASKVPQATASDPNISYDYGPPDWSGGEPTDAA